MEVVRENFYSLFPEVKEAIEGCSFMAIDTELSGLRVSDAKENFYDTMEERYEIIRETSRQYIIIQFGLVAFFYDEEKDAFTHKAYNFYTYPSETKNFMPTVRFLCESASIEFLSSFGFDFNKLFHHGIPYLSNSAATKVRDVNDERQAKYENEKPTMLIPENFKKFMEETRGVVKRFLASAKKEYIFESLAPIQRRLIFENLKPQHPNLLFETVQNEEDSSEGDVSDVEEPSNKNKATNDATTKKDKVGINGSTPKPKEQTGAQAVAPPSTAVRQRQYKKHLKVTKVSDEELQQRKQEKKQKFEDELQSMVGFSKVIEEIGKSNKIVVGHNMLLDISHSVDQFVEDLPTSLADFKNLVQCSFPNLVDTKLMASQLPFREFFKSSVLPDVMKRLETDPFEFEDVKVQSDEQAKGYDLSQGKFHEAGYDAYITGLCFISMCKYLGTQQTPVKSRVLPDSPLVMPYINKLYLMRMMDICYMNISGTDLSPSRSHVFHVQCPKNTTVDTLRSWFSPFGDIQYHWKGEDVFISLLDKEQSSLVMRNLEPRKGFGIMPFDRHVQAKEGKVKKSQKPVPITNDSPDTTESSPSPPVEKTKRVKKGAVQVKRKVPAKTTTVEPPSQVFEQPGSWN